MLAVWGVIEGPFPMNKHVYPAQKPFDVERLLYITLDVEVGASLRPVMAAVPCDDHDRGIVPRISEKLQELNAGHFRHVQVEEDQGQLIGGCKRESFLAVRCGKYIVIVFEKAGQSSQNFRLIVY